MTPYLQHPEVLEALAEARQAGFREGFAANQKNAGDASARRKSMERFLWAAVMSNGGRLAVHKVDLAAFDRGDYVSAEVEDPRTDSRVLLAHRRACRGGEGLR